MCDQAHLTRFREAVAGLAAPPFPALLREALEPTSAAAITRLVALLAGWGSPRLAPAFASLELEERCFLATARGLDSGGGGGGSLLAAVLFSHAPPSELGRLSRTARTSAWELLVGWGGVPPTGADLHAHARQQYALEYAPYEREHPPAVPSLTRMLLEVAEEQLGHGSSRTPTLALLDLTACHAPALFERLRGLYVARWVPVPAFDVLHLSPALEAAFREGDSGVVAWAVRTGMLPSEDGWPCLSTIAGEWLRARKLAPLQHLFAVGLPQVTERVSAGFELDFRGAEWAIMQAALSNEPLLLEWAFKNVAPVAPAKRGPAALFGAVRAGPASIRTALASGCAVSSDKQVKALYVYALQHCKVDSVHALWCSGFDIHLASPARLFRAYFEGYLDELFKDMEIVDLAVKLREAPRGDALCGPRRRPAPPLRDVARWPSGALRMARRQHCGVYHGQGYVLRDRPPRRPFVRPPLVLRRHGLRAGP